MSRLDQQSVFSVAKSKRAIETRAQASKQSTNQLKKAKQHLSESEIIWNKQLGVYTVKTQFSTFLMTRPEKKKIQNESSLFPGKFTWFVAREIPRQKQQQKRESFRFPKAFLQIFSNVKGKSSACFFSCLSTSFSVFLEFSNREHNLRYFGT